MTIAEYIQTAPAERRDTLTAFHKAIIANDIAVIPVIKPMMGKDMILYEERGMVMKYGLADTKNYISLHCLPMYMNPPIYNKYQALAPTAKFQKGCINFNNEAELPLNVATDLIKECSAISIVQLLEKRKKKKQ